MDPTTNTLLADPFVVAYPEMRTFWEAAAEGRFLLRHCTDCARAHWYPRMICPLCASAATDWREACGRATLFSFSSDPKATGTGVLAYVTLEEGPRMLTRVVQADPTALRIGQPLRVHMQQLPEGRTVPVFTPVANLGLRA